VSGTGKILPHIRLFNFANLTEEDAKVVLLRPRHKLVSAPNAIKENDWSGWIKEKHLFTFK
jgi:hypothetical protein